jgi:hypothetical protein
MIGRVAREASSVAAKVRASSAQPDTPRGDVSNQANITVTGNRAAAIEGIAGNGRVGGRYPRPGADSNR